MEVMVKAHALLEVLLQVEQQTSLAGAVVVDGLVPHPEVAVVLQGQMVMVEMVCEEAETIKALMEVLMVVGVVVLEIVVLVVVVVE